VVDYFCQILILFPELSLIILKITNFQCYYYYYYYSSKFPHALCCYINIENIHFRLKDDGLNKSDASI